MAEWLKATVSKTVILSNRDRGFESHPLRQPDLKESSAISKRKTSVSVALAGFGHVGKAFVALLQEKGEFLRKRYDLELSLRAVLKSSGGFIANTDLAVCGLSEIPSGQADRHPLWKNDLTVESVFKEFKPGILAECTPSDFQTEQPGLKHIRAALENGWHVATANKGPLVVAFKDLSRLARKNHLTLRFSGATAALLKDIIHTFTPPPNAPLRIEMRN